MEHNDTLWGRLKIIFVILVVLAGIGGFAYYSYQGATNIYVDNPTDKELLIQFDGGKEISIPADTLFQVPLKTGEHTLTVNGEELGVFEKKLTEPSSFLNPTKEIYVKEYILYIADDATDLEAIYAKLPDNEVDLYGEMAYGPFEKFDGIYIKKDWDYGITVVEPEEVNVGENDDYIIKTKLYRYSDFVDMYNKDYIGDTPNSDISDPTEIDTPNPDSSETDTPNPDSSET